MKISVSAPLLLLVFFLQAVVSVVPQSRCPGVRLQNGRVRARTRGRIIKFSCYEGFTLVGNKYSTCIRNQWDTPTPVCVNAECSMPPTPDHALVAKKYNGAILLYFCEPGYALIGPTEIYCDGSQWNGTTPHCRDTAAEAPTSCDFEKPDLCWWEQDPQHDFDWRRHNFETPSSHIGTGPTYDHTLGHGNDGFYLYIEASGRLVNDTARIVSPIYKASYTEAGCFSFWYHMYGATIGALNIYFKPEKDNTPQLMFSKAGNQGNYWLHGIFNLPKAEKGFQIIIEGVRGSSYVSDIAIDDVAILQGDNCPNNASKAENEGVTESYDDQIEQVNAQLTCRGRCKNVATTNFTSYLPPSPTDSCLCTIDCAERYICCPDYAEYCVLGFTEDASTEDAESTTASYDGGPRKDNKDNVTDIATMRPDKVISIYPKDDIEPVTSKPLTTAAAVPVTTVTRPKTERPLKTTQRTIPTTATTKVVQTKETPFPKTTTVAKTLKTTRRTIATTATAKVVQTNETPFQQTTTVTKKYLPVEVPPDPHVERQDLGKVYGGTSKFSQPGIIGMVVGILAAMSITFIVAIVILRRRKTYKRGTKGGTLSEDSDVRFLTSDEILDFTLARPSENDET
ncbi:uncharacterized protein LOC143354096 [Halictus rubicundus]|uniref:uncharacterized protein LOC143354096 n=1 Tax=Halictus rubicundus TaxID=77578 RepID=UPI0040350984